MTSRILLNDLINLHSLPQPVLLIRHKRDFLNALIEGEKLEEYQSFQSKRAFRSAKTIVSFTAEEGSMALLYGIYVVDNIIVENPPEASVTLQEISNYNLFSKDFFLELRKMQEYEKFKSRLFIKWTEGRKWYVWFNASKDKEVVKILPYNYVRDFPGLSNLFLTHQELKKIINNKQSHLEWYNALANLQAIYLILDKKSGKQYVGCTNGKEGLWQRWRDYTKGDFSGGNLGLKSILISEPDNISNFSYSVLEVLSKTISKSDVGIKESLWMRKLGTRINHLN